MALFGVPFGPTLLPSEAKLLVLVLPLGVRVLGVRAVEKMSIRVIGPF